MRRDGGHGGGDDGHVESGKEEGETEREDDEDGLEACSLRFRFRGRDGRSGKAAVNGLESWTVLGGETCLAFFFVWVRGRVIVVVGEGVDSVVVVVAGCVW